MSMFHELMMRKKEQIMYATIKGALTENDGVFSGFSTSNYLEVNYTPQNINNYELGVKFTLGNSVSSTQTIIGQKSTNVHTPQLAIDSSRKLFFSFPNASHSWVSVNTTYALNIDTTYEAKMIWTGNKVYAYLKSNSVWELVGESVLATNGWDEPILIGLDTGLNAWGGSIDLNNSYIKLGSTKYNLQAVVGYTIVGSPTITDGVASGFSSGNYLYLPALNYSTSNIVEINLSIRFLENNALFRSLFGNTQGINVGTLGGVGRISISIGSQSKRVQYSLNRWYSVKIIYQDGNTLAYLDDTFIGNIEQSLSYNYPIGLGCDFNGSSVRYAGPLCEIDLNNTYIKINNKLWFNGQQA